MRFGIALESFTYPDRIPSPSSLLAMSETAENSGFNSVWVWDHLLLGSKKVFPVLDSLSLLAWIGSQTKKIKLGTSVLILTLRNPVVLAKTISTIQFLTNGRLILGSAVGWYKREFDSVGVPYERRGKIFEEKFRLVKSILNSDDVNYMSEGIRLEHVSMRPRSPVQVPLLMGGYSDAALARIGKISDGWISYYYTPDDYFDSWKKVEDSAIKNGRSAKSLRRVNIVPLAIGSSFEEADRIVSDFTQRYMDLPKNTKCKPDSAVRGNVKQCIEQIQEFEKLGIDELVLIPCYYDLRLVEIAGREILPFFS